MEERRRVRVDSRRYSTSRPLTFILSPYVRREATEAQSAFAPLLRSRSADALQFTDFLLVR